MSVAKLAHPVPLHFYMRPHTASTVMSRKELRAALRVTEGWIIAHGQGWNLKPEHMSAGMYHVTLEPRY